MSKKKNNTIAQIKTEEIDALFRNNLHRIVPVDLDKEMRKAFIDYAMSVISDRALPDVRDGLKPVHRRILYAMHTQGFTPDKSYRKCATTVGVVLGKFHPHGDAAVYEAMVRLAQDFSMRHTMIDGHGNFGSRDGDPPAAYRYTEARLEDFSMDLMKDIHKDTVDFKPNFDEHEMEPVVLPSRIPNLLVNGSLGIAVGMATNIPPHNLAETIDATIHLMNHPEASLDDILKIMPGPDFPTGGTILGSMGIRETYAKGRGRIVVRATAEIEEMAANRQRIVVTDLPYMVNKARLIERIAELVKEKKIEGISFVRDESDREDPVRIVIELKRDVNAHVVLNQLYKMSSLQEAFSANMLALVPDEKGRYEPKNLTLLECLSYYIQHQKEVVTRRVKFDLDKTEARLHLLEGLRIAFAHIDEIIAIIRASKNAEQAKQRLMERFGFTERQAQHIGDMRLIRLTNLEQVKIEEEFAELLKRVEYFNEILNKDEKLREVLGEELLEMKEKYQDERRTRIEALAEEDIEDESLIQEEEIVVTMTHFGYIKRQSVDNYRTQKRGGRGISGLTTREEDEVSVLLSGTTHQVYLFFTNLGRVFKLKGYQLPDASRQSKGTAIVNLLGLNPDEKVKHILPISDFDASYELLMATEKGMIKKTSLDSYANISKAGLKAIVLKEDDHLIGVALCKENQEILLCSANGYTVRFSETQIRSLSRGSMGVRGIKLRDGDSLKALVVYEEGTSLLVVTKNGYGKKTEFDEYASKNRATMGVRAYKNTEKTGPIAAVVNVREDKDVLFITDGGVVIRIHAHDIPSLGRVTQGVKLMRTQGASVVDVAVVDYEKDEDLIENAENADSTEISLPVSFDENVSEVDEEKNVL